jgi:NAD(P)-dependent dehydrogenase (short-subunit alcohol dehydrogenase family)
MTAPIKNMMDAFSVKGLNVVVTGGNRGIGLGISQAFAQCGANVAILCRNEESGKAAVEELSQYGGKYITVKCDTADMNSVKAAAIEVFKTFNAVDVLVNNAGISTVCKFLDDSDLGEWHRVINTNLHGPANMVYVFAPYMKRAGKGGSIINISSIGGQTVGNAGFQPMAPYNCSKAALNQLTKYLAIELGDYGIRVNAIAPGPTHSDLDKDLPPVALQAIEDKMPMHRFGEPIEIGALCVFLASPAGSQITGTISNNDGGMVLVG